jgi:hypothetical protein
MGLLPVADFGIQRAEAAVAMGLERAHAELVGEDEGLTVMGGGLIDVRRSAMRGDLAKETQGIRLVGTFLALTGERQCLLGEGVRFLHVASQCLPLPEGEGIEHLMLGCVLGNRLFQRLHEQ